MRISFENGRDMLSDELLVSVLRIESDFGSKLNSGLTQMNSLFTDLETICRENHGWVVTVGYVEKQFFAQIYDLSDWERPKLLIAEARDNELEPAIQSVINQVLREKKNA